MLDETWEQDELVGQLIDVFEDWLVAYLYEKNGDRTCITGADYDDIARDIKATLANWGLISHT